MGKLAVRKRQGQKAEHALKMKSGGRGQGGGHSLKMIVRMLMMCNAPHIVVQLALLIGSNTELDQVMAPVDQVEYFAGQREVTKSAWDRGRHAIPYDMKDDPETLDITTSLGFIRAFHLSMKLRKGGNSIHAPVCSSWGQVNRGTSGRSALNPLGNLKYAYVRNANVMVSRVVIILWLQLALGVFIILEQPLNSLMEHHPRMAHWIKANNIRRTHLNMKDYGAPTKKATWLYSQFSWITEIEDFTTVAPTSPNKKRKRDQASNTTSKKQKKEAGRAATADVSRNWTDAKTGKKKYAGGKGMKASQAYPHGFGEAVAKLYERHEDEIRSHVEGLVDAASAAPVPVNHGMSLFRQPRDKWSDAMLRPVFKHLV